MEFEDKSIKRMAKLKVMSNTLILARIAKELSVKTLRDLRVTCSLWNSNFVPHIKQQHHRIRNWDKQVKQRGLPNNLPPRYDLINLLESSFNFPFNRYSCHPGKSTKKSKDTYMQDFLTSFANANTDLALEWAQEYYSQIQVFQVSQLAKIIFELVPEIVWELKLSAKWNYREEEPASIMRPLLRRLPNLKKIKVDCCFIPEDENDDEFTDYSNPGFSHLLSDVFRCADRLEVLDLDGYTTYDGFILYVLKALLENSGQHLRKLKTLKLPWLHPPSWKTLIQVAEGQPSRHGTLLRLEVFSVVVMHEPLPPLLDDGPGASEEELEEASRLLHLFLKSQSPSLKELTFSRDYNGYNTQVTEEVIPICLPRLERLKEFTLMCSFPPSYEIRFDGVNGSGTFADTFPRLRQLSCVERIPGDLENFFSPTVTEFRALVLKDIPTSAVDSFGRTFPSLTRLELTISSRATFNNVQSESEAKELAKIWTTWPNLISLKLRLGDTCCSVLDLDSFLTGVPRRSLEHLRHDMDSMSPSESKSLASLREVLHKHTTQAGIANLRHLQKFEFSRCFIKLTDIGGYFGVALISPDVQRLMISTNRPTAITHECLTFIKRSFSLYAEINVRSGEESEDNLGFGSTANISQPKQSRPEPTAEPNWAEYLNESEWATLGLFRFGSGQPVPGPNSTQT